MDELVVPIPHRSPDALKLQIVRTALRLGEQAGSWDAVHVHAIAREVGISFTEFQRHFDDKDSVAEGFFDMADQALLAAGDTPGWADLTVRERLFRVMMAWFDALVPHRRLVAGMLGYKLHPEHVHLQVRGIMRVSRTNQWIREVAMMPSVGLRREIEEAVVTTIYLTTFASWLRDASPGSERTRALLQRLLSRAERGALWLGFGA